MRTKVGEVLTADLADALAAEAERGYDLARAKRLRIKKAATNDKELVVAKLDAALYDEPTRRGAANRRGGAERIGHPLV
jgi:hypothetical protein